MKKLTLLTLCLLSLATNAQQILWEKSYGGDKVEYLFDAIPTADFGFILAGSSLSSQKGDVAHTNQGNYDYWLWKMDEHGDMVWQKSFGGDGHDLLKSIKHTKDGGFILAGTSNSNISGQKKAHSFGLEDLWVIKLNAAGVEDWQVTLGGRGQDYLSTIEQTNDGGFIIGATSNSDGIKEALGKKETNKGGLDYWVIKLDQKGKIDWQKNIGGNYEDQLTQVITTSQGYLVAGYSNSDAIHDKKTTNNGETDYWVIMLDQTGKELWQRNYGQTGTNVLKSVLKTRDNHIILAGEHTPAPEDIKHSNTADFQLIKIDFNGDMIWEQTHKTVAINQLTNLIENQDGTLLISGYGLEQNTVSPYAKQKKANEGENDYILIKLTAEGNEIWQKIIGSNGQDQLSKAIETRDGGYLLTGTSDGKASRDKRSHSQAKDFWLVKLQDPDKPLVEKPKMEAFPNPTARYTNVIVGFEFEEATVTIADLAGRIIHQRTTNDRTVPIDLGNQPEGIYIVEVRSKQDKGSVKILKEK